MPWPISVPWEQQLMQAAGLAQQAMLAEQSANPIIAASLWEQTAALLGSIVVQARSAGMPCPDQIHFAVSMAHQHCGRLKFMLGQLPDVRNHVFVATEAIQ